MKIIYRYNTDPVNYGKLGAVLKNLELSSHDDYEWEALLEIRDAGYSRMISENEFAPGQIELYKTPTIG